MATFDIGDVPTGWQKGESLEVNWTPRALQTCVIITQSPKPYSSSWYVSPAHVYGLHANHGEEKKVKAWLDWWES
jgi:hypothetical protein